MECPRCSNTNFVKVKRTHALFPLLGRVFARFTGYVVICPNCKTEMLANRHGVRQPLFNRQQEPPPVAENGKPQEPVAPRLRDMDQPWSRPR